MQSAQLPSHTGAAALRVDAARRRTAGASFVHLDTVQMSMTWVEPILVAGSKEY